MKKLIFVFAVVAMVLTAMTGCKKGLQNVRGLVTNVEAHHDTLISLKVLADGDSMVFKLNGARFQNGVMFPGDSVIVDYVDGSNDSLRALVVTVLPKVFIPEEHPFSTDSVMTTTLPEPEPKAPAEAPEAPKE